MILFRDVRDVPLGKPFTINRVTALWHSFILSVVIFPLLAKVNGVTFSEVPGAGVFALRGYPRLVHYV